MVWCENTGPVICSFITIFVAVAAAAVVEDTFLPGTVKVENTQCVVGPVFLHYTAVQRQSAVSTK